MAVVINEFEVIPRESDTDQRRGTSSSTEAGERLPLSPEEVERLLDQQLQREERVWAH
jgi:hypothetical protein